MEKFLRDPKYFFDLSPMLALEVKFFQAKMQKEKEEKLKMGMNHLESISEADLKVLSISKREFDLIKRMMKFDPTLFEKKEFSPTSPLTYLVDISKYQG